MKLRRSKQDGPPQDPQPAAKKRGGGSPRWRKAEREIAALRRRVTLLEAEVQEARHLNKRLADITDVVSEVLLPAEQRDEERLRAILSQYDSAL